MAGSDRSGIWSCGRQSGNNPHGRVVVLLGQVAVNRHPCFPLLRVDGGRNELPDGLLGWNKVVTKLSFGNGRANGWLLLTRSRSYEKLHLSCKALAEDQRDCYLEAAVETGYFSRPVRMMPNFSLSGVVLDCHSAISTCGLSVEDLTGMATARK